VRCQPPYCREGGARVCSGVPETVSRQLGPLVGRRGGPHVCRVCRPGGDTWGLTPAGPGQEGWLEPRSGRLVIRMNGHTWLGKGWRRVGLGLRIQPALRERGSRAPTRLNRGDRERTHVAVGPSELVRAVVRTHLGLVGSGVRVTGRGHERNGRDGRCMRLAVAGDQGCTRVVVGSSGLA
jgi:hypothetical protein